MADSALERYKRNLTLGKIEKSEIRHSGWLQKAIAYLEEK